MSMEHRHRAAKLTHVIPLQHLIVRASCACVKAVAFGPAFSPLFAPGRNRHHLGVACRLKRREDLVSDLRRGNDRPAASLAASSWVPSAHNGSHVDMSTQRVPNAHSESDIVSIWVAVFIGSWFEASSPAVCVAVAVVCLARDQRRVLLLECLEPLAQNCHDAVGGARHCCSHGVDA